METVTVRAAVDADAATITRIVELSYAPYVARMSRRPAPMDQDYAHLIASAQVWVAQRRGDIVGVAVAHLCLDHVFLENVAVHPQAQHAGVGRLLMRTVEDHAACHERHEVRLYTNEAMTENLDFYPRLGYRESHRAVEHGFRRVFFVKTLSPP